ncbi:uncharacterized protein [Neodiprion pinetum]|uniref:Uncharacterized protein LOC107216975 isoform X1 n=1 Tax=Neodiprion lecontei TaxID=441921 RepID=A0ABM3FKU3_NEOLC|nr:uncharacterized protein LOC124176586 [Neodiprion fabricii]XP_046414026.1 uncharacterized protein LOC124176586 [Neodiprion fabricii]XP_046414027.1 uncharacterized protein LOC124176586 [Neodiprion fabricii]XP_046414028.1 uncharacterized protein LOC124176586 [Neodiprion fabricii]XP_046414030.1 uncharacterized protein LOC124176586 [Neodiprion fabricii]XP_046414031.1 uncharacterized protein LOC124176586 [Neodiprion fabricii]XP_046414032.1 uncharacterized protein LOC124176586 [Neodiprion fabrici
MDFTFVLFIILLRHQADAVKLLHIHVPPYTIKGENAILHCRYDLGLDKLYSVTWYKDHEEFYRYVPRSNPTQHSYLVDGVKVDAHMSDSQQVFLRHVSLRTSGLYRCEVSAEAPSFTSVHGDGHMEVISLPQEDPQITGEEKVYASGDILALNCTSSKSFPPARLKWFINGVPARSDYEALIQQHGLVSSVSGLRLEVGPHHLTEGKINVRCEATVQSSRPIKEPLIDYRKAQVFVQGSAYLPRPCLMLLVGFLTVTRLLALS